MPGFALHTKGFERGRGQVPFGKNSGVLKLKCTSLPHLAHTRRASIFSLEIPKPTPDVQCSQTLGPRGSHHLIALLVSVQSYDSGEKVTLCPVLALTTVIESLWSDDWDLGICNQWAFMTVTVSHGHMIIICGDVLNSCTRVGHRLIVMPIMTYSYLSTAQQVYQNTHALLHNLKTHAWLHNIFF